MSEDEEYALEQADRAADKIQKWRDGCSGFPDTLTYSVGLLLPSGEVHVFRERISELLGIGANVSESPTDKNGRVELVVVADLSGEWQ